MHAFPEPLLDLVFVHGLGGTSTRTWSFERDPANFWPPWLGQDSDLSRTRIFTFGYNASVAGQFTSLNMLDFAKDLLFRMKTFSNDDQPQDSPIGKVDVAPSHALKRMKAYECCLKVSYHICCALDGGPRG